MSREVEITLAGLPGAIDPMAVADAISALDKMLASIQSDEPAVLRLSDLRTGSAIMGVRSDQQRIDTLLDGVDRLAISDSAIPQGWATTTLRALLDLHKVSSRSGVDGVRVRIGDAVAAIDETLASNASALLDHSVTSLGSVRGMLYRYSNDKRGRSAGLREVHSGQVVQLTFPARLANEVKGLLDHEINVWGVVHRDVSGDIQKIEIEGLEAEPVTNEQPTLDEVAGILGRDWTNGLGSVEWVRQQRE